LEIPKQQRRDWYWARVWVTGCVLTPTFLIDHHLQAVYVFLNDMTQYWVVSLKNPGTRTFRKPHILESYSPGLPIGWAPEERLGIIARLSESGQHLIGPLAGGRGLLTIGRFWSEVTLGSPGSPGGIAGPGSCQGIRDSPGQVLGRCLISPKRSQRFRHIFLVRVFGGPKYVLWSRSTIWVDQAREICG